MNNKQGILVAIILIVILLAGGFYYMVNRGKTNTKSGVTFPSGGETLVAGKTYTLRWKTPTTTGSTTQIFLVDKALLSQGASVSITDRAYNVSDTGTYDYTIPTAVPDSTYFFVIGAETISNDFMITSKQ
jgi:hypothetical protein